MTLVLNCFKIEKQQEATMKSNEQFIAESRKSFAEEYQSQSRRPERPVPVFQGTKRYQEAEEEE